MGKGKWYKRKCASYTKLKDYLKARHLLGPSNPNTNTSSPNITTISPRSTASSAEQILRKLSRIFTPPLKDETFRRDANVAIKNGDSSPWSKYSPGVVIFDTGSQDNLVTVHFLKTLDMDWEPSVDDTLIIQMDSRRLKCPGEVKGRWRIFNSSPENFRPRYEISSFKVVDVDTFDLIIGSETIKELGIFQVNRTFFGAFVPRPIRRDCKSVPFGCERSATDVRTAPGTAKRRREEHEAKLKKEREDVRKSKQEQVCPFPS